MAKRKTTKKRTYTRRKTKSPIAKKPKRNYTFYRNDRKVVIEAESKQSAIAKFNRIK